MALHDTMAEALRLTRAGDLSGATELIRASLSGGAAPAAPSPATLRTIDLVPERVSAPVGGISEGSYQSAGGSLGYRLYVPAGAAADRPLVIMLHGCTQSPEDFARGTRMDALADELGFIVAYPRQTPQANPQKCWNWFRPRDQRRDGGEPAMIAGIARRIVAEHRADPTRVYVAGLSAGGAAAAVMAAAYPDLFAATGIHSGLACGSARDVGSALAAMKNGGARPARATGFVPTITFHGDRDGTVAEINAGEIVAAAAGAFGKPLDTRLSNGTSAGGRLYTRAVATDPAGHALIEQWTIHGAGHAWSGGDAAGSYTDPAGPDASREMLRFFLGHRLAA